MEKKDTLVNSLTKSQIIEGIYYKSLFLGYINYGQEYFNEKHKRGLLNRGIPFLIELSKELNQEIIKELKLET